jgi:hypothetical protein
VTQSQQWMNSNDPAQMLIMIPRSSVRKLSLWVEACRNAAHSQGAEPATGAVDRRVKYWSASNGWEETCPLPFRADLLREIFGDPFRVQHFAPMYSDGKTFSADPSHGRPVGTALTPIPDPIVIDPNWLSSNVVELAATIYRENSWELMPILADALQEAGCEQADILAHCRQTTHIGQVQAKFRCPKCGGPGYKRRGSHFDHERRCGKCNISWEPVAFKLQDVPNNHVRGCWLIDLLTCQS